MLRHACQITPLSCRLLSCLLRLYFMPATAADAATLPLPLFAIDAAMLMAYYCCRMPCHAAFHAFDTLLRFMPPLPDVDIVAIRCRYCCYVAYEVSMLSRCHADATLLDAAAFMPR